MAIAEDASSMAYVFLDRVCLLDQKGLIDKEERTVWQAVGNMCGQQ